MTLPKYAIQIILLILFFVAAGLRFSATTVLTTPYYKGTSAINYHHVVSIGEGGSLNDKSPKANWPEGYQPSAYRASGAEYVIGMGYRAARYLGELNGRRFVRRVLVLMYSLLVFVMYLVARKFWDCQAGGLIAAFLATFFTPLIAVTNGRSFEHATIAFFLIALHWLALLRHAERPGPFRALLAGLGAFAIVAVWEYGAYYVVVAAAMSTFVSARKGHRPLGLVSAHAVALIAAAILLPHARAVGLLASWPTLCVFALAIYSGFAGKIGRGWRGAAFVAGVTVLLTIVLTPIRSGIDGDISAMEWFGLRVRYLLGKPQSPLHLPDAIRYLWSEGHAPPALHALIKFWLPAILFGTASLLAVRKADASKRRNYLIAGSIAVIVAIAYTVDRGVAGLAAITLGLLAAGAGRGISQARPRGIVVALGAYVLLAELIFPLGLFNPTLQIARAAGSAHRETHGYTWVSLASTDRELVRYVATRTSVRDPFVGNPDITSILLTFVGRTAVLPIGTFSKSGAEKYLEWYRLMYGDPSVLRAACVEARVRYVLYSIDFLLDSGRYSPRYLAGLSSVPEDCAVWRFHFSPQRVDGFTLVYENEHFRLYEVTDRDEPSFITDHPPVYQHDFFTRSGGNLDEFNQRVIDVMLTYNEGLAKKVTGNEFEALQLFTWCLGQAPGFTRARVAVGTTLAQMGRHQDALDALNLVLTYAPDDAETLYATAYANARLGNTDMAKSLLDILFSSSSREKEILEKANLLRILLEQNIPLDSPVAP